MLRLFKRLNVGLPMLLSGLLIFFPGRVSPVEVKDLYDIDIPVDNRDSARLNETFELALIDVLMRVTGKREIITQNGVGDLLKNPAQYVQQYRYMETEEQPPLLRLWVRFDGPALEGRLIRLGLPVWGKERPAVLIWLAIEQGGQRYLAVQGSDLDAYGVIKATAHRLRIPVIFPLLDLEDRNIVSVADVVGGFDDRVRQASTRYRADAALIVRATGHSDGYWKTHWRLYSGDEAADWVSSGNDFDAVLRDGMEHTVMNLSSHLAVNYQSEDGAMATLIVDGVEQLEDYARLLAYIDGLALINRQYPHSIEATRASFQLHLRGAPRDLERLIDLGGVLSRVATPASLLPASGSDVLKETSPSVLRLHYQLLPGE
jgi:hypothetical protein